MPQILMTTVKYWRVSPVETLNYGWSEVVESHALCHKFGAKKVYCAQLAMLGAFRTPCNFTPIISNKYVLIVFQASPLSETSATYVVHV